MMEKFDNLEILKINHSEFRTRLSTKFKAKKKFSPVDHGLVKSFIPGTVVEVLVKVGQSVTIGQELLVLDAMKMKNRLLSLREGTVKEISVKEGERIPKGTVLLILE